MPPKVGRRIVVYGWTGSGKTAVACRIGAALGLPVIDLDAIFWSPGDWRHLEVGEFKAAALELLAGCPDGWVCDGNYASIRDAILPQVDTAVVLQLPLRLTYWRLMKRTVTRAWTRKLLWGTNRESLRSRGSLLLSSLTERVRGFGALFVDIAHHAPHASVIVLRSSTGVKAFLADLDAR